MQNTYDFETNYLGKHTLSRAYNVGFAGVINLWVYVYILGCWLYFGLLPVICLTKMWSPLSSEVKNKLYEEGKSTTLVSLCFYLRNNVTSLSVIDISFIKICRPIWLLPINLVINKQNKPLLAEIIPSHFSKPIIHKFISCDRVVWE